MTATLTPSERAASALPPYLRRYVVPQDYAAYTPRDQAVWRHILRRLVRHLASRAHPSYLRGLEATGIGTERIPSMDEMNEKLSRLGWSAVSVRGFIPPAVFTELQALRVLAIAGDIRTHEHIEYTPAPDIVHESAGHAPILADPSYAAFLQAAGELGFRAIASAEDEEVYEAIRALSIVKEDPEATPEEIADAEGRLGQASASRRFVSEATRASRLYWWTAEYGLVGTLDDPKIYGAGLLSSIGESARCLSREVEHFPLGVQAADVDYDITRMQPQLFVARDFGQLREVVDELAGTLAWRRGGEHGLGQALAARTVNHLVLDGGTAVAGVVEALYPGSIPAGPDLTTALAVLRGPTLLSRAGKALCPPSDLPAVVVFGDVRSPPEGPFRISLQSGLVLSGRAAEGFASELRASIASRELGIPERAILLASRTLPSVAGGPGDPGAWDERFGAPVADEEGEARARAHKASALAPRLAELYREVRALRESGLTDRLRLAEIAKEAGRFSGDWLLRAEIEELLRPAAGAGPAERLSPDLAVRAAVERARSAPRLALVLDYDGTLVPFASRPELATPDAELLGLLRRLVARPRTEVHLVSGRKRDSLERFFGSFPLGLHAEHCFWSRPAGGDWRRAEVPAGAWREPLLAILHDFTERTPGSFFEEKTAGFAWHYRTADPEFGAARAQELSLRLSALLEGTALEVLPGDRVVEIRPLGIHKGLAVARVLALAPPGTLLFAMGDDRTDEDLFAALPEGSIAVHVGPSPSRAPIRIADVPAARALLAQVAEAS